MTGLPDRAQDALHPLRDALLADAHAQADALRRDARQRADTLLADAHAQADALLAAATADGRRTARAAAALRSARARRQAHETVLARQNALLDALRQQVTLQVAALRDDPRYPDLVAHLTARAHQVLGPDAVVSPSPHGGVVARSGSRHLDLSLPALATRTLDEMTPEVSTLWTATAP
ncbi:V-type ATP synthase subunit E family protein [Cellulomonas soli]|uniref:V-type ATP synthase subunit E family protein n=1 Tax=Cellulomonas soli TaxID=931535 RepID=UPI003F87DB05